MTENQHDDGRPAARPSAESVAKAHREAAERELADREATAKRRRGCAWIAGGTIVTGVTLGILSAVMSPKDQGPEYTIGPGPAISQECMRSMNAAADAPGDNDAEMIVTLSACATELEWIDALKIHPGAGSLVSYTDADAREYLALACALAPSAPACSG